jgi:Holliday junction resolvase-like predicted endonuclease
VGERVATPGGLVGEELGEERHTEANVQAAVVTALAGTGWRILSVANTATKEHGIDVIAEREGRTVGVEVKGFPSHNYADPARR